MKKLNLIFSFVLVSLWMTSCSTELLVLKQLDGFQPTKYYQTDIIPPAYQSIYGKWKFANTSGGLINGVIKPDFDYLLLKPNAIFGIVKNDSLIAYGKLTPLAENTMFINNSFVCKFDFDKNANIGLSGDPDKYISLVNNDSLVLNAPCCDRINAHFIRQSSDWYNTTNPGTLKGKITIGPLCPVETVPPKPGCTPTADTYKAWQTAIWNSDKNKKILDVIPNLDGTFQMNLSEGDYVIDFASSSIHSFGNKNLPLKFTIKHQKNTEISVNIDTGIR